jgi:hypothetical protein
MISLLDWIWKTAARIWALGVLAGFVIFVVMAVLAFIFT